MMDDAVPGTIEAELLRTFVAIADSGSFTEAAKRVHRTQSAVSMQVKRLEEALGRPVFDRDRRLVRLTPDGERLLGHARRILRAHREALAAFGDSDLQGTVRLGTPDEYAVSFLPAILARFAETHPFVHVEVICDPTVKLLARLADQQVDLALTTLGHGEDGGVVLLEEPVVWAASAHHCVHEQDPVPLALFHAGCKFRQWAIDALAQQGRCYRIAYTSMSLAAIEASVRTGLAVSVLPRSNVREGIRILGEHDGYPALPNYRVALQEASGARSPIVERLRDHILESFRTAAALNAAA